MSTKCLKFMSVKKSKFLFKLVAEGLIISICGEMEWEKIKIYK